ncbi:MAG: RNA polymerase sigma factor [Chitinophagaceae bacterium]|nr:MAG: RNA polymerase sigma factor [Chitinophagaceae bacterium]
MNQQEQFTALYNDYAPGIKKLCLGYTGDAILAQDLLQDTFIAVWNNMQHFRADAKWSTWIYRIAVNTCLTQLRKKKDTIVDVENSRFAMLPDDNSNKEQEVQLLYKCISRLAETDRVIITMVLEDTPYEEIAGITGITENNLRVKIHRIKKQLTEIYNSHERL